MVDLGIGFPDDTMPGIDVVLPDLSFIEKRRDRLEGLVITHGHEDHLGAIPCCGTNCVARFVARRSPLPCPQQAAGTYAGRKGAADFATFQ